MKEAIITLHGGCFTGGDVSWDQDQNNLLKSMGLDVYQLDFPKNNYRDTIIWLEQELLKLKEQYDVVYLLGRSSGGYLAKQLFEMHPNLIAKVFYLAPVFTPALRAAINPFFGMAQNSYFRYTDSIPGTLTWNRRKEILFLAIDDENVPIECFTQEQRDCNINLGIIGHQQLTTTYSNMFRTIVELTRFPAVF
jgi:pimeloyl-ACP methyl ester carboxylesterase